METASVSLEFDPVAKERDLDVLSDKIEQVLLLAPLRHHKTDLAAPEVGEVGGDRIVHRFGEDHLLRRFMVGVVAGQELLEETFSLIEGVLVLPGKRPPVNVEEHQIDGSIASDIVDDILVVGLLPVDMLTFAQPLEGSDLVTEIHRPFVIEAFRVRRHLIPERPDEPADITFEDGLGPPDSLHVILLADPPDTGGAARADVRPQARPPGKATA